MYTYPIDYDLFTAEEVSVIIEFLSLIEDANEKQVNPIVLSTKHREYRKIVNSIQMEKKIDHDFEKVSGYSIYKTIKKYQQKTS
ncbi:hypothetical protein KQ51_01795 [Candidatus Izimaplasma bacterium HR1]|jgi:uncharacterized protein YktA (UPF0223 family)|uniref:UPF0223 family protein n=1 Tax=Candidatus Izimoplasma sp. HR1 TaxID=1541959 RepID=UPI0004F86F6E|nr:hypothetical protein KQ51_01795 [Candidatus Izimaplasma bacterium HR1]